MVSTTNNLSPEYLKSVSDFKMSPLVRESIDRFKEMKGKADTGDRSAKYAYEWAVSDLQRHVREEQNPFSGAILQAIGEPLVVEEKKKE